MIDYDELKNKILFGKYKLTKIIGKGSFGCVFQGTNLKDKSLVAVKVERRNLKANLLKVESNFLSILKGYVIPEIKSFGYHGKFYILVEELLGANLIQIYNMIKTFSLKDIAMIAIQIIDRIEYVHSKNIIHRDIKPENFVFGRNNPTLYIIDFGISRKYRSSRKHLKFQVLGKMFGTVRFASYNASRGLEQSRRDDLESIGYMLIFLSTGRLPWQGISLKEKNHVKKYLDMLLLKKYISCEVLCKNLPPEFISYIKYCRNLGFEQDPDYEYLRNLFKNILLKNNQINDMKFSWIANRFIPNNKNMSPNKYINYLTRKGSSQKRLFKAIQNSLDQDEKEKSKSKERSAKNTEKNNIIKIEIDKNSHKRVTSEETTRNTKFDVLDNSNLKSDLSYNSILAHFNMNVNGFEDEDKIYVENISRINSIKNKKVNNNEIINNIELNSYNYKEKKDFNIFLHLSNYSNKNKIFKKEKAKKKFNISLDLDKNFLNISNTNDNILHSKSENINYRCNLNNKNELSKTEENRRNNCRYIYFNIISKMKKYFEQLAIIKQYMKLNQKRNTSFYNTLNSNNKITKPNINQKSILLKEDSFSFKNINIDKYRKENGTNFNRIIGLKKNNSSSKCKRCSINKIYNNNNFKINNNNKGTIQRITKRIMVKHPITNDKINNNNNFDINSLIGKQNIKESNNNKINIIINNNVNSFKKYSPKSNKNTYNSINYRSLIPNSQSSSNIIAIPNKKIINNNFYSNDIRTNNYISRIPRNIKNKKDNIKLIPNVTKPIKKNYFIKNQTFDCNNNNNIIFDNYKLNNLRQQHNFINLNNNYSNNNLLNMRKIQLMQYKPLYITLNSSNIENQKIIKKIKMKSLSNSNIKDSLFENKYFFPKEVKSIQLNNKNRIRNSPKQYNNQSINKKNNNIIFGKKEIYKNNMNNNFFLNDLHSLNEKRKNTKLENTFIINSNSPKIYISTEQKKNFRQPSPINNKIKYNLNYCFQNTNNELNKIISNRSYSNSSKRKCLNFNLNSTGELQSLNYVSKNINRIIKITKNNYSDSKCFNSIKI